MPSRGLLPPELQTLVSGREHTLSVLTFWLDDMSYAVASQHVHSVVQDLGEVRKLPFDVPGLMGVMNYTNRPVPIFDFAHRLGRQSDRERNLALCEELRKREVDHLHWVDELHRSLEDSVPFNEEVSPHRCAFGRWLDTVETRDADLNDIIHSFRGPHYRIHALAEELLAVARTEGQAAAIRILDDRGRADLERFRRLVNHAITQLSEFTRSVLLFVSKNGRRPSLGLRIDEVAEIVNYHPEHVLRPSEVAVNYPPGLRDLVVAYLSDGQRPDCIMVDLNRHFAPDLERMEAQSPRPRR